MTRHTAVSEKMMVRRVAIDSSVRKFTMPEVVSSAGAEVVFDCMV